MGIRLVHAGRPGRLLAVAALLAAGLASRGALDPSPAEGREVRMFAVGAKLDVSGWLDSRAHFHDKWFALFDRSLRDDPGTPIVQRGAGDVASHLRGPRDRDRPVQTARDLVVLPEDAGLWAMLTGPRGAQARLQDLSSSAAVASLAVTYAPQLAYYEATFPELALRGVPGRALMTALTDTFARVAVETFAELADRYDVYLHAGVNMARDWRVVCTDRDAFNSADPARLPGGARCEEESPAKVLALRDPAEPGRDYAYEATAEPVNMGLIFDPDGRLISKQVKTYLTPSELPGVALDLKPGEVSGLGAVRTPVGTLGVVTSKDAWMPDVQAKLDQYGVDVLLQPEYFLGDVARTEGPWAADTLHASGYNAVLRRPGFEAMVLPQLTGNAFDLPSDQQSHIVVRPRSKETARDRTLIGQPRQRGFAEVARWLVDDPARPGETIAERRRRLGKAGEKALPGSGVECRDPARPGPCEGGQAEQVLFVDVEVDRRPAYRPYEGLRSDAAPVNHPLAPSEHPQRNLALAADGEHVVAAFEEFHGGPHSRVLVARSEDGGRTFAEQLARPGGGGKRDEWNPAVSISGDSVFVAWTEARTGKQRVRVAVSGDGGLTFGRLRTVPASTGAPGPHSQWLPELDTAPGGRAHLAYLEESALSGDDALPQTHVHYRRLGRDGTSGPAQRLDQGEPVELAAKLDHSWAPAIAAHGDRVAVAWVDFRTYDWRPYARLSDDGGRTFDPEREVSDTTPLFEGGEVLEQLADSPSVALDRRRAYVAWTDWRKEPATLTRPSRAYDTWISTSAGGEFGPEVRADDAGAAMASTFWPAAAARHGDAFVAWQDSRTGTGDIRLARLAGGADRRKTVRVDDTGDSGVNQYRPQIALSGGRAIVGFEDERDGPLQIYLARLDLDRIAP